MDFRTLTIADMVRHYSVYGYSPYDTAPMWVASAGDFDRLIWSYSYAD